MSRSEHRRGEPVSHDASDLAMLIRENGPHCLLLARHGETDWNAQARLQGQRNVPLNTRGRSQARALARVLASIPVSTIHSSTLTRCVETAARVADVNSARPRVIQSPLLKETALGVLEGESKARQSTPELARHYAEFSKDEINYRVPGGENLHDVFDRVDEFLRADRLSSGDAIYLIVGHRNVNKMLIKHLLGLSFEEGLHVKQEHERLYLFFGNSRELWSCWLQDGEVELSLGHATTSDTYA